MPRLILQALVRGNVQKFSVPEIVLMNVLIDDINYIVVVDFIKGTIVPLESGLSAPNAMLERPNSAKDLTDVTNSNSSKLST